MLVRSFSGREWFDIYRPTPEAIEKMGSKLAAKKPQKFDYTHGARHEGAITDPVEAR